MLIATHNVNGIRAAERRGLRSWLDQRSPDVVCLQEVRCRVKDLPGVFGGYHLAYDSGSLAGRNGVAIMSRTGFATVRTWGATPHLLAPDGSALQLETDTRWVLPRVLGEFSAEGRYIEVDLAEVPLTVACVYVPKGESPFDGRSALSAEEAIRRHERKMSFLAGLATLLGRARKAAKQAGREFVVLGDFNIAHTIHDLRNWRSNQQTAGFLPVEREWLDGLISPRTLVDVVRRLHPESEGPYSWWSWRGQAFARDTGWRIDYHLATPTLAKLARTGGTDREAHYDARISDHAPVVVDYAL